MSPSWVPERGKGCIAACPSSPHPTGRSHLAGVRIHDLSGDDALAAVIGSSGRGHEGGVILAVRPASERFIERGGGGLGSVLNALVTLSLREAIRVGNLLVDLDIVGSPVWHTGR